MAVVAVVVVVEEEEEEVDEASLAGRSPTRAMTWLSHRVKPRCCLSRHSSSCEMREGAAVTTTLG